MARGKLDKPQARKDGFYVRLAKDIEVNGSFFMKSRLDVLKLAEVDPNIRYVYDKEENLYFITYKKTS